MKECNICHIVQDEENFYKRKDRNGEYTWVKAYCKKCDGLNVNIYQRKHPEIFKAIKQQCRKRYRQNHPDRVAILHKKYYYNNLLPDKQIIYKNKLLAKYPEWVEQICGCV